MLCQVVRIGVLDLSESDAEVTAGLRDTGPRRTAPA
jgi:hypothetical protein